jgi:hypothetical protein
MRYLGKSYGFASQTYSEILPSKFLPDYSDVIGDKWRSPVTQSLIRADVFEFDCPSVQRIDDPVLSLAIGKTFDLFRLPQQVPMYHLKEIFDKDLNIWSSSPGLPWKDYGYKTKGDIKRDPDAIRRVRKFAHLVKTGHKIEFPDCLAFARSHICEYGTTKVRAVWGYPATVTFMEAMFALPLIEAYQAKPMQTTPIAYGFETATGGVNRLIRRFSGSGWFTSMDFKKFDKTIPAWLIEIAFDILMYNIDFVHYAGYGVADARRNILMFYTLRDYFINTKIRLSNGLRFKKDCGIASGSYFTQLVGSVVNTILINYLSLKQFGTYPHELLVLGDDSLVKTSKEWDFNECQKYLNLFGMSINVDKSCKSQCLHELKFLGYTINMGYPRKEFSEWMAALVFPERPDECLDDVQSRALGLYHANMCIDMNFARICYTIIKFKEFDLRLPRNLQRMLKMQGIRSLDPLNVPTPMDFWVRYLK